MENGKEGSLETVTVVQVKGRESSEKRMEGRRCILRKAQGDQQDLLPN